MGRLQQSVADNWITRVEVEVTDDIVGLIRPIASAVLTGILQSEHPEVNHVNAPVIAQENGITIAQTRGLTEAEYPNVIACKVFWEGDNPTSTGTEHTIAGIVLGGKHPRLIQFNRYYLEANPDGVVLLLRNKDVPGVIGKIGTLLGTFDVNIAEWRLGRVDPGGEALAFINLDEVPPPQVLDAISAVPAVVKAKIVEL